MEQNYHGITIDTSRDNLLADYSKTLLKSYYLNKGETSPQEAFARTAIAFSGGNLKLAQRMYDYASKKWLGFASPVLSNAPSPTGEKSKGLPISCFLLYVPDTVEGLIEHTSELRRLSVKGGGVGGHWSDIRSASEKSYGVMPFLKTVDSDMLAWRQGKTRKGSYAAYMDVSHPEVMEFIEMRGQGRDDNRTCKNLHNAINITDDFLNAVEHNKDWNLVDPKDGTVVDTMNARKIWEKILSTRARHGEPYISYIDQSNRGLNPILKELGLKVQGSNLCSEITLPTNENRTAVCCLSSINIEYYDEWKDTSIIEDLTEFLDNVLTYFIDNAEDTISKAKYSAIMERSIGIGAMGFHTFLQRKMVAFESVMAKSWNNKIFKLIQDRSIEKSVQLGKEKGVFCDLEEYLEEFEGEEKRDVINELKRHNLYRRNSHLLAVAPTANNSMILDVSPSVEPYLSNVYIQRSRIGAKRITSKYLMKFLSKKHSELFSDTDHDVWLNNQLLDIINNSGSVSHITFMTDEEKIVFKTAYEIDQRWLIDHARDRQEFICQGQSINLFFDAKVSKTYVNTVHLRAFKPSGTGVPLKTLYYYRTKAESRVENINNKVKRNALKDSVVDIEDNECLSCHS